MSPTRFSIFCALVAAAIMLTAPKASAAEKLSDILRESNWEGIAGTWVDAETNGENFSITFAWKIKDRVMEVTSKYTGRETVALMGVNGKTGEVFHMGADSDGTSTLGKWDVDDKGDAVLGLVYTTGEGQDGVLSIRYHREDEDTTMMTIELPEPIKVKLVRSKTRSKLNKSALTKNPEKRVPAKLEYVDDLDVIVIRGAKESVDKVKALIENAEKQEDE